jgi:hypothetical protein
MELKRRGQVTTNEGVRIILNAGMQRWADDPKNAIPEAVEVLIRNGVVQDITPVKRWGKHAVVIPVNKSFLDRVRRGDVWQTPGKEDERE